MPPHLAFHTFPAGSLIAAGLRDLRDSVESTAALLVSVGAMRLREAGVDVPPEIEDAERKLYDALAREHADAAHGRYNALIRQLVSFERAVECAR
jgi:hypothetical protein